MKFVKGNFILIPALLLSLWIVFTLHCLVPRKTSKYQLSTGEIVECGHERYGYLTKCIDGFEYRNQTNYRKLP